MLINQEINTKIKEAMKARDKVRLSTLKMLSSALHNAEIDKGDELTSEEELSIVRKEAKKRGDAAESYKQAGRGELAKNEQAELDVLQDFLPAELSDDELEKIVKEAISNANAESVSDMGSVMALAMDKMAGRADGKRVSELVKQELSSRTK